jgi:LysR family transcriptional regulator of abg operon
MKLNHLRDAVAVAECGSFRAAARQLGIAQSALSRSIHDLEHCLGAVLFQRGAKGVMLTTVGERFIGRANAIQNEVRRAQEEVSQLQGKASGRVHVALSNVPHLALLPYALPKFREKYPNVQLQIRDALFRMIEGELRGRVLDCYIGPIPEAMGSDDLIAEKLFDNTRVILGRKGHPLANARSLRDLVNAQWLTTSITYQAEEELGPLFSGYNLPSPRIAMQAHSALTFFVSIAYSDLLTMLPSQWTEFALTRDALQKIEVAEHLPAPSIYIVRRIDMPPTPAAEYFCDLIRRAAAHLSSARGPIASILAAHSHRRPRNHRR